ncbi:hypothetical protein AALO_G00220410 [Alosa alosa]|uniref:Ig-like domain-containing protein n=1 Tax=Alosa alosa TaxID=278164 RepID=A0AAV6FWT6_9TELE|nr:carcinoembryonic antigen-related cell adhesion molecule 5-like [Alosa alosa]KAG5267318.1 hypothetical protein AALO_G00220410 [Alosa alosa]
MTLDGLTKYSNQYDIIFKTIVPSKVLTCEAKNPSTGETGSISKTLHVADGPYNASIQAPKWLVNGVKSTFVCSAVCYPSCEYTWYAGNPATSSPLSTSTSNELHYLTPQYQTGLLDVFCEVQNTLSQLFVETSVAVWVPQGPTDIYMSGPTSAMVGTKETYYCFAYCTPSCNYIWYYQNKTFTGDEANVPILNRNKPLFANILVIQVEQSHKKESLVCSAVNVLTGKTVNHTMIINVADPICVLPITATPPIADSSYSLKCVGAQQNAYIYWTKNGKTLSTSDTVHLADNNVILTFDPLRASDTGVYQCIANEQGNVIPGVPYELKVIYGPLNTEITVSGDKLVGQTTLLLPGTSATFYCSAKCYPACTYVWYNFNGDIIGKNASFSFTPASVADEGLITCVAFNPITQNYTTVNTNIELIGGPKNVTITGPNSVQVGVKATFECSAVCTPSCVYTWEVYGRTIHGSKVDLTISKYVATETLLCIAQNIITGKLAGANETLDVTDTNWCGC